MVDDMKTIDVSYCMIYHISYDIFPKKNGHVIEIVVWLPKGKSPNPEASRLRAVGLHTE